MAFAGGDGTENNKFQIETLTQLNDMGNEPSGTFFILNNDIDVSGGVLVQSPFQNLDLNGKKILNIPSIEKNGSEINFWFDGMLSNGELNFNWTTDQPTTISPFNLTNTTKNVKISGSITNTNPNGSVAGAGLRGLSGSENILVTADLSAHNQIFGLFRYTGGPGSEDDVKNALFFGTMTDLSGSAELIGSQGSVDFQQDKGTNLFWDFENSGTKINYGDKDGGLTTVQAQTLSTYTTLYNESYRCSAISKGSVIETASGLGVPDFTGNINVEDTFYLNGAPFVVDSINGNELTPTTTVPSSIVSITGGSVGTGDGLTTVFDFPENQIVSGTVTVYIDGVSTTAYSLIEANGNITFDSPPADGAVITADFDYGEIVEFSVGTGTYKLTEPFDMVDIASFDGSQTWVIDDGNGYPDLGIFVEPNQNVQGLVTFESTARPNAPASIFSMTDLTQSNLVHVEDVITDGSGNVVGTVNRDPTLHYMFVARDLASDFTGTIAAVSGTGNVEIDTGLDLSALNMGTDHYVFRATSGSNAGDEVTVLSRLGNTITLRSNPGFQVGDTFIFGRVIKGTSDILLAD